MNTWIFLRGLTRESRHWGDFPATFRQALPDAEVHTPDLPGNGSLYRQRSPGDVAELMADVRRQLIARGTPPPYRLLAMSLGAMVAVAWATHHPEEILGCVLINTSLRPFSPFYRRLRPGCYRRLLQLALPGGDAREREGTILALTTRHAGQPEAILRDWSAYRQEFPVTPGNALRQLLAAARYSAPLARPAPPLLILTGRRDALVHTSCSRQLASRWQTAFAEHPTAGHDLPLDAGPWVAAQVGNWLSAAPSPPAITVL